MKVIQVFRKSKENFFSIEKVYQAVNPYLDKDIKVEKLELQASSANLKSMLSNFLQLRKAKADIYHITGEVNYVSLFFPRKKVILTLHDCNFVRRSGKLKGFILKLFWLTLPVKYCRKVIAISEATKADVIKLTGCNPRKIEVIPNPVLCQFVPLERKFRNNPIRILQVGTRWNKNLERVLESLTDLPCHLTIIGQINETQRRYIQEKNLDVVLLNNLSEAELVEAYQQSDLVLFVSLSEGFGLPILEAQASGIPVITSNIEPMRTVSGNGATLADPYNVEDIRQAVLALSSDILLGENLVKKGYMNVEKYRPEAVALKYSNLYKSIS